MVKVINIFFIFLFSSIGILAQEEVKNKRNELTDLKAMISKLEKQLDQKNKAEWESVKSLEKLNQQSLLLTKLINNLKKEENQKQFQINLLDSNIVEVENEINTLTDAYSKYIVWVYKNKGDNFWKYLLDAESINSALVRLKYLNYLTKKSKANFEKLKLSKNQLTEIKKQRIAELEEKEKLVNEKKTEQENLSVKKNEKNELVKKLRKDKKFLNKEITDKRNAEILIKNMISKLIEDERIRKTKENEEKLVSKNKPEKIVDKKSEKTEIKKTEKVFNKFNYDSFENFASLKGKLNWPVKSGSIVRKFGENVNKKLKTVTLNYGIDIQTKLNNSVSVVAEGVVSAIDWIPGFGSVIIVTHKNNFRTVYGHVGDIAINEGDIVKRGTLLGSVNESLEGSILHFEIWNDRNYQNPEIWLAK